MIVLTGRHVQTTAQAAASLASALRARGAAEAARSLRLNFAVQAGRESVAATATLWQEAMLACPLADELAVQLHWHSACYSDALLE